MTKANAQHIPISYSASAKTGSVRIEPAPVNLTSRAADIIAFLACLMLAPSTRVAVVEYPPTIDVVKHVSQLLCPS